MVPSDADTTGQGRAGGPAPPAARLVVVDWSVGRPPRRGPNSIWIATVDVGDPAGIRVENPPTPALALALVDGAVDSAPGLVLVGVDVCLGFPAGFSAAVAPSPELPWRAVWGLLGGLVADDIANRWEVAAALNHLVGGDVTPGPFWGHVLGTTKPAFPVLGLAEWRATELALRHAGWRPTSPWQAAYTGAVGLQSLTAIGLLDRWRAGRGDVAVWPFELPTARTRAVVAEVYPSMHPERAGHAVRDARQVAGTVLALEAQAAAGGLQSWWSAQLRRTLPGVAVTEEGWTLGVAPGTGAGQRPEVSRSRTGTPAAASRRSWPRPP